MIRQFAFTLVFCAGVATLDLSKAKPYISPVEESITEEAEPEREYLGKWRITEYCTKCNSGGSRQTASGKRAEEWYTCAVSKSNYRKYKGYKLYVEGYGTFEIMDWGSVRGTNKDNWVDLFLPKPYHNKVWKKCDVYLIAP